jgi:hypothetical protein
MLLTRTSPFSGKENTMNVYATQDELEAYWKGSGNIQDVLPHCNENQREFIKTGITPQEWDDLFGEPEPAEPTAAEQYAADMADVEQELIGQYEDFLADEAAGDTDEEYYDDCNEEDEIGGIYL